MIWFSFVLQYVLKCLNFLNYPFQEYIPSKPSHVVRSLMYLIDMLLAEALEHDPEDNRNLHSWIVVSLSFNENIYFVKAVSHCSLPDVLD